MKEILGNNLEQFFFVLLDLLDYQKECERYAHTRVIDMKFG